MAAQTAQTIYLKDYTQPDFLIEKTFLDFTLAEQTTRVCSKLRFKRNGDHARPLVLAGQELKLISVTLDGTQLPESSYLCDSEQLSISKVPDVFELEVVVDIEPQNNTSLEGLYKSRTMFCSQCEAEGFRKITYYLDRPDVLSVFTTRITADKSRYPVLLSNGNLVASADLDDGCHTATWEDPFPKPSYLFALVAGDLACVRDTFTTRSGRHVSLELYVEDKDLNKCDHAIQSLKHAMAWDEKAYGCEYDLDVYMIVAVDDFNMGAMENKGLNIFNTSCVLANPDTTTDAGFQRVEGVVAHEYFHNWSGNRVTCRDWFQLSLKEGFTVFRDEEFSADMGSRTVKRVEDVQVLRSHQFPEDAGPMAHPVRPASFIEISNFYTATVYEKGAEVVRMIHTLIGPELFRKGSDLYFQRHDGQAVTIEDFVAAMSEASGRDFSQFMNWYHQAGTPLVRVEGVYDAQACTYQLSFEQSCPSTPEASAEQKQPFHIPIALGLLGEAGALRLELDGELSSETSDNTHCVLELTRKSQTFTFCNVPEEPVPALLRGFSAPIKLEFDYSPEDLLRLMSSDSDGFVRWDAAQKLSILAVNDMIKNDNDLQVNRAAKLLVSGFKQLLNDESLDPAMVSLTLRLPSESYVGDLQDVVLVEQNHRALAELEGEIAESLKSDFLAAYQRCSHQLQDCHKSVSARAIALRSLKNVALSYLMQLDDEDVRSLCLSQIDAANNMTEVSAALNSWIQSPNPSARDKSESLLQAFYQNWKSEPLVVNQWLAMQAKNVQPGTLKTVRKLMESEAFDIANPNKVRSLIGMFCSMNVINFHHESGEGYQFLADQIIILNHKNPQVASRLLGPLTKWRRFDVRRQELMKAQLERILSVNSLSKDVYEVVSKSLAA